MQQEQPQPGTQEPEMPEGEQGEQEMPQGEEGGTQQTPPATPSGGTNPDPGSTTVSDDSGASHNGAAQ